MSQYSFYFCDVYPQNLYDNESLRYKSLDTYNTLHNKEIETIKLYDNHNSSATTELKNNNSNCFDQICKYLCCCFNKKS